jgi:phosphatidate cytidylyltransferase
MTRVLSAVVLIPIVVGTVWFLPPVATLLLAAIAAVLAFIEYADLAAALGQRIPRAVGAAAVVAACAATAASPAPLDLVVISALIVIGSLAVAAGSPGPAVLRDVACALFPVFYIGVPLGTLAAVRWFSREALLLLMATIVISDSAQYYSGRAFGRHLLAPAISPKKTVEGAAGGMIFGTLAMTVGGTRLFPYSGIPLLILVSATVVALGMVGDLFESLLKRSAGLKDSSSLIPGHGGVLDRIDSWLFAGPVFYVFTKYLQF